MKRIASIIAAAFLALLLAACPRPDPPAGIPAHLREIMEANRAIALPPFPENFLELAGAFLTQGVTIAEHRRIQSLRPRVPLAQGQGFREIFPQNQPASRVTHEEAAEDILFLFDLMKYGYAGYQYFGGDDVFLPIRDSMLERLAGMPNPMTGIAFLDSVLAPALRPAIADNHFQLHNIDLGAPPGSPRMSGDFVLRPGPDGFVTVIDDAEHRLIEATLGDGQKVGGVLPTLTRDGEAAFAFGHFAAWDSWSDYEMSVVLERSDTGERRQLEVTLRAMPNFAGGSVVFHEFEANGVPVVVNRTLSPELRLGEGAVRMRESGESLRGEPVVVLDLRGHDGGYSYPMLAWMHALTGSRPSGRAFASFGLPAMIGIAEGDGEWAASFIGLDAPILPNESLLIVLTDGNIASAGELLVGRLRELENVIFVGTNTKGVLVTAGIQRTKLPLSGLNIIYGSQLNLRPDLSQFEGLGFMPDLWVPPAESLERVLAFIERYGLLRGAQ